MSQGTPAVTDIVHRRIFTEEPKKKNQKRIVLYYLLYQARHGKAPQVWRSSVSAAGRSQC